MLPAVFTAPIAPEPLVPLVSTPLKLTICRDAKTVCARLAVTVTLDNGVTAKARHISEVPPPEEFALATGTQVRPPPLTLVTDIGANIESLAIKASSNSFPVVVEKEGLVIELFAADKSTDTLASVVTEAWDCAGKNSSTPSASADSARSRLFEAAFRRKLFLRFCLGSS